MASVGEYLLSERLGRGGMADVWAARHGASGQPVVIKVLRTEASETVQAERELRAVSQLDHPGILRLEDFGELTQAEAGALGARPGSTWLALERARGPWPAPAEGAGLLSTLRSLLLSLAHAHARGVLHLDVKPSNLLTSVAGQPVLSDFGIARLPWETEALRAGSPPVMAPEQWTGGPVGPGTDLYAVGCCAVWWWLGAWPWPEGEPARAAWLRQQGPVQLGLAEPLAEWIRWLTEPRLQDRPPSAAHAAAALPVRVEQPPRAARSGAETLAGTEVELPGSSTPPAWVGPASRRPPVAIDPVHRAWPLVGRQAELAWLDARWGEVVAAQRGATLRLGGAPFSGQRALSRSFLYRVVEEGRGQGLAWLSGAERPDLASLDPPGTLDDLPAVAGRRPLLAVLAGPRAEQRWLAPLAEIAQRAPVLILLTGGDPGLADLWLERVPEDTLATWLATLAPLEPELAGRWVREAEGRPGWLVHQVRAGWREGRLRPAGGWWVEVAAGAAPAAPADYPTLRDRLQRQLQEADLRGASQVAAQLTPLLAELPAEDQAWAWVLLAHLAHLQGALEAALGRARAALQLARSGRVRGFAWFRLGVAHQRRGEVAGALAALGEAERCWAATPASEYPDAPARRVEALLAQEELLTGSERLAEAKQVLAQALAEARRAPGRVLGLALARAGSQAISAGEPAAAIGPLREAREVFQSHAAPLLAAIAGSYLARAWRALGELGVAREELQAALAVLEAAGSSDADALRLELLELDAEQDLPGPILEQADRLIASFYRQGRRPYATLARALRLWARLRVALPEDPEPEVEALLEAVQGAPRPELRQALARIRPWLPAALAERLPGPSEG